MSLRDCSAKGEGPCLLAQLKTNLVGRKRIKVLFKRPIVAKLNVWLKQMTKEWKSKQNDGMDKDKAV